MIRFVLRFHFETLNTTISFNFHRDYNVVTVLSQDVANNMVFCYPLLVR